VADDIRTALIKHGIDPQTRNEAMAIVQSLKEQGFEHSGWDGNAFGRWKYPLSQSLGDAPQGRSG
jgi:hypothetical protein